MAKKLQSSLAVEGELPADGLAAYGDDGDDLMLALARKIVGGEEDTGTVESVFAEVQQVAAEAEALLVDDGWKAVEVEPEVVEVHANGNGHGTGGIGPGVELVAGSGGAAAAVTGNGHAPGGADRDEAPEPQQSLFSWAEFLAEEPVKPQRGCKREAPTLSLFEWALSAEQEGALVGARR